ncbi:J domain-containing protein 1 [Cytospora paraplurivora]|uniref:J domain-containing protein 1 n=1 Tax=Cytospora paraplurivora TaxID=2898453 RepID=A0AAN9U7Q3_9PEZI
MFLNKSSKLVVCSSSTAFSAAFFAAPITSSSTPLCTYAAPPAQRLRRGKLLSSPSTPWRPSRQYATVREESDDQNKSDAPPAPSWPASKNPTPYEIFDQAKADPYNKKTFHQLVKLYHPDRHQHTTHLPLSHATKIERYRLIVSANDILSDPAKRRSYDLYGAGWGLQGDMRNKYREAEQMWRSQPDSAANNATWEDWERWHARQKQKQDGKAPVYDSSNQAFTFMIVGLLLIATFGRMTMGFHVADLQEKQLHATSGDMRQIRERKGLLSKEDRIDSFLKEREWAQIEAPVDSNQIRRK